VKSFKIRLGYHFDVSCQGSVPEAIIAFLESADFENGVFFKLCGAAE
jgi:ADP-ribosylglycohydrolase